MKFSPKENKNDVYQVEFGRREAAVWVAAATENVGFAEANGEKAEGRDLQVKGSSLGTTDKSITMSSSWMYGIALSLKTFEKATPMVVAVMIGEDPSEAELERAQERLEQSSEAHALADEILHGVAGILVAEIETELKKQAAGNNGS